MNTHVSVTCREACREDIPEALRLYAQPDLDNGSVLSLSEAERHFERIATYPDYKIHVAFCEKQIVGTFALLIMDNLAHMGAPSAIIEDVAVDPGWQGRGVGKQMMKYALQICGDKRCYKAVLSSNLKRKKAHAFYESLGFEQHGYSYRVIFQPNSSPDSSHALMTF
ncbi:MAG: GNAT family N-acetyltransferase [Gallionella sp.]